MSKSVIKRIIIFFLTWIFIAIGTFTMVKNARAFDVPKHDGYVSDYADVLSDEQENSLEKRIQDYDNSTTNQIAILTTNSTEGQDIRDFGIKVFDDWKVGQAGKDNGIIFIIAVKDRKMSIEVGRGLEGDLTDVESKHIIDEEITPHFKENDYATGINKGVDKVIGEITPDYKVTEATASASSEVSGGAVILFIILVIIVIIFLAAVSDSSGGFGGGFGSGYILGGGFSGGSSSDDDDDDSSSGGFGGFGGGTSSGGGASSSW